MAATEGAMRMGKYEMGRTLGEGHFGKVRLARHADTGRPFAIKILDREHILAMKIDEQIKTEIATLKLLKHPNVVHLYEGISAKFYVLVTSAESKCCTRFSRPNLMFS
ncbi:CBL-interacting protein kinase 21-like [Hordeum vulgare subsp. vulgare]|uniref:CBL-interacting protein kinase 21-like n=1 Tax=Hordeum vulgare subsp. vulgare TaxID=112509 RepID=UPI000B466C46|nr:CBL-interacting protein kinase 21-like [Hordeum vulgare subsp. vulgare]